MLVVLLSVGILLLFFVGMSIRMILVKDGEFRGTCASQSPWLNKEGVTCNYCGKTLSKGEACGKEDMDKLDDNLNKELEELPQIKRSTSN